MINAVDVVEKGTHVIIDGDAMQILEEFCAIVKSIRQTLSEDYLVEDVDMLIAYCAKLVYAESEEEKERISYELIDAVNNRVRELEQELVGE